MSARRVRRSTSDQGYMLVMTMVLTLILSIVVGALAAHTTASLRYARAVSVRVDRLAAADGAMNITIERLRTGSLTCDTTPSVVFSTTLNTRPVEIRCQRQEATIGDVGTFSLVVTAQGVPSGTPSFEVNGAASVTRRIQGNVFMQVPPATLGKPIVISDGDLWYKRPSSGTCVNPSYSNLTFTPPLERGYICDASDWTAVATAPTLGTFPTTTRAQTGSTNADGCVIFQPGIYNAPPIFGAGTENFMQPGTYYFNFSQAISIKRATVIVGTPGSSSVARVPTTMPQRRCKNAIAAATQNAGATWVLAGGSRVMIDTGGQLELFSPAKPPSGPPYSIVALSSASGSYAANTNTATGNSILDLKAGATNGVAVHGAVWMPTGKVVIENVAQRANSQFMGGMVVAAMDLQNAARVGNVSIASEPSVVSRAFYLEARADDRVTVRATVRADPVSQAVAISSWNVM